MERWQSNWDGEYIILLQSSTDKDCSHSWRMERGEKFAFQRFEAEHPLVAKHLQQFEKDLRKRSDKGKFWWELRSCAYYSAFTADKIVWGKYGDSPRFLWDDSGFVNLNTIYFIKTNKKWLLPIMNSALLFLFSKLYFNVVKDDFIEYTTQAVSQFPIPTPTPAQIVALESFTDDSHLPELNELVYDLYGLNPDERALVEELTAGAYGGAGAGATDADDENEGLEAP